MVIGTKKDDATLVLLTLDQAEDVMQVEVSGCLCVVMNSSHNTHSDIYICS